MTNSKDEMKKEALIMAEKMARDAVDSIFKIAEIAIKDSENKIDDIILAAFPMIKDLTIKYIDRISEDVK